MESVLGVSGNQVFVYPANDLCLSLSAANPQEALDRNAAWIRACDCRCFQHHGAALPLRHVFNDDESLRGRFAPTRQFRPHRQATRQTEMHLKVLVECCSHAPSKNLSADGLTGVFPTCARTPVASATPDPRPRVSFNAPALLPLDEEVSCRLTRAARCCWTCAPIDREAWG